MQVKLLQVIQEREVLRVGARSHSGECANHSGNQPGFVAETASGTFREDLYYRLNVVSLALPFA